LTANAIAGNEEMFLASGFNDFLSKPIDIMRLDAVIHRWIRDKSRERTEAMSNSEEALQAEKTVSSWRIEGLDIPKALIRFGGGEDVLRGVFRSYTVHVHPLIEKLRNIPGPGETEKLENYIVTVHSAKGAHYGISADDAGKIAADLEQAARRGDLDYIAAHNGELIAAAEKIAAALSDKLAGKKQKPKKAEPDADLLLLLKTACLNYQMDEVDRIMQELEQYDYESRQDLIFWLRERIGTTDFQAIVEKI
jgi:CheY-like chemotaxis protein